MRSRVRRARQESLRLPRHQPIVATDFISGACISSIANELSRGRSRHDAERIALPYRYYSPMRAFIVGHRDIDFLAHRLRRLPPHIHSVGRGQRMVILADYCRSLKRCHGDARASLSRRIAADRQAIILFRRRIRLGAAGRPTLPCSVTRNNGRAERHRAAIDAIAGGYFSACSSSRGAFLDRPRRLF